MYDDGNSVFYVALEEKIVGSKSGDHTAHLISRQSEIKEPGNSSLRTLIDPLAEWAVAPCWNYIFCPNSTREYWLY